jgi:hypothetical protein
MGPLILFSIAFGVYISYYPGYNKIGYFVNHSNKHLIANHHFSVDRVLISASKAPDNNDGTDAESNKKPGNNKKPEPPVPKCTGGDDIKGCNNR